MLLRRIRIDLINMLCPLVSFHYPTHMVHVIKLQFHQCIRWLYECAADAVGMHYTTLENAFKAAT